MRNRFIRAVSLALGVVLVCAVVARSEEVVDLEVAAARLAAAARAATPGEARVAFVREDEVYLDQGQDRGFSPGVHFVVSRPGPEIRSPATGQVIGRVQNRVARIRIEWSDGSMARARRAGRETAPIEVGDLAAPESGAVIAFFPLRHDDGRRTGLTRRVDDALARAFAPVLASGSSGGGREEGPAMALRPSDGGYAVQAVPTASMIVGGRVVETDRIELVLMRSAGAALLAEASVRPIPAELAALAETRVEGAPFPSGAGLSTPLGSALPPSAGEGGEIRIPIEPTIKDACAADVDGDGRDEILFLETRKVRVMRLTPAGGVEKVEEFGLGFSAEAIRFTAGDLDGDGKDEIAVVEKPGNFVRSTLWRKEGRGWRRIHTARQRFLRFVAFPDGDRLYSQGYGTDRVFESGMTRHVWDGNRLKEEPSGIPPQISIFDWAPLPELGFTASLDPENRIRLYNAGAEVGWSSSEAFGGSRRLIRSGGNGDEREMRWGLWYLPGPRGTILAVQNLLSGGSTPGFIRMRRLNPYRMGRLVGLSVDGGNLVERFSSAKYDAVIEGMSVGKFRGRGVEALLYLQDQGSVGNFGRDKNQIVILPIE